MSDTSFSARLPSWAPKAYLVSSFACSAAYLLVDQLYPYVTGAPALKAFGIVLLALYSGLKGQGRLALALALSACGDYALALGPEAMTLGIAFFATAHLVYLSIFIGQILSKGIAKDGVILAGALCLYLYPAPRPPTL